MNTLETGLKQLETNEIMQNFINENENVMICCGRMGPMCIPVYDIMEELETEAEYENIKFRDVNFDSEAATYIRSLPITRSFTGLPFTMYFKNGKVVAATSSIQNRKQITEILDREF